MTMTMTHSGKVNQRHNPREKESVKAVLLCILGNVCSWDTVDDNVQSHKSKKEGTENTERRKSVASSKDHPTFEDG